jgi:hypothetical protein
LENAIVVDLLDYGWVRRRPLIPGRPRVQPIIERRPCIAQWADGKLHAILVAPRRVTLTFLDPLLKALCEHESALLWDQSKPSPTLPPGCRGQPRRPSHGREREREAATPRAQGAPGEAPREAAKAENSRNTFSLAVCARALAPDGAPWRVRPVDRLGGR